MGSGSAVDFKNIAMIAVADPEREAIANDGRPPWPRRAGARGSPPRSESRPDREDDGGARHDDADDRNGFRQGEQQHRPIGEMRVCCDERGDAGEKGHHKSKSASNRLMIHRSARVPSRKRARTSMAAKIPVRAPPSTSLT